MVPEDSSAARMPRPGATMASATLLSSARFIVASVVMRQSFGRFCRLFASLAKGGWGFTVGLIHIPQHTLGVLPPPLWGRVGEGGGSCCARCAKQPPPPLTPPQRKSGLPDLRTILRNPGKPGFRGEGNRPSVCRVQCTHFVGTRFSIMLSSAFGVLFDGFAYGMLLFLLSVGLSVTLGMMNFVNLAHCSFAMLGGYVTVSLTNALGWPFLATLPLAFLAAAAASVVLERVLYRRLYRATDLDQCLLTIGIVFISVAVAAYLYGTIQQPVNLPSYLRGTVSVWGQSL